MADANTKTYSRIEEIEMVEKAEEVREEEVNIDESIVDKWTMLNENSEQSDNESSQSREAQNWIVVNHDAVLKNDDVLPKDNNVMSTDGDLLNNCSKVSKAEDNFDSSDSISVITEHSTDLNDRISQVNDNLIKKKKKKVNNFQINGSFQDRSKLLISERQRDTRKNEEEFLLYFHVSFLSIIFGILIGNIFTTNSSSNESMIPGDVQISNGIDRESLKMTTYNIDNIYKELPQVKAILDEIRARISDDANIRKNFLVQLSEIIDSSNKMSDELMTVTESFSSNSYPLDQLQVSLRVLSSLAFIDDNISLKNEMNKTLDIVNNTKAFYETLISFNNNTQNNSAVLKFLQSGNDMIRITSEQLFSDLVERMNKVMLNVYKKYAKVGQKLNKKLCYLKNILPDDELLKQLTENNQFFKNYDKSCFSNRDLKKLNDKRSRTKSANNVKQIKKADDTVLHMKHDEKNIQKIYDNRENSLKNERNETQSINNSTTINSKKIKSNMHNNYNTIRDKLYDVLSYLEDIRFDPSKLEQLTKNCGEKSEKLIDRCEGKSDCPQSVEIQKNDLPENTLDSTLIIKRKLNDACPFSELNKWPEFDNDIITSDRTVPDHATENYNVDANNKHKVNSTKTVFDNGNSANIMEEKSRSKQENDFKLKDSTFNNKNAYDKERDVLPQNKMENQVLKDTFHHEFKQTSLNKDTIKQDDKSYTKRKQWRSDTSDWYFQRADSRKNARKDVKYQRNWYFRRADSRKNARKYAEFQRKMRLHQKKRHSHRIVYLWNSFVHNYNKFLRNILAENVI